MRLSVLSAPSGGRTQHGTDSSLYKVDSSEPVFVHMVSAPVRCAVLCSQPQYGYTARHHSQALTDPSGAAEPYHPSWGNFGPDSRGECGAVAARRFHMPNRYKDRRNNAPFWYSFDYGNVHFTVISTEHALTPGSRQYEWLAEELSQVDR